MDEINRNEDEETANRRSAIPVEEILYERAEERARRQNKQESGENPVAEDETEYERFGDGDTGASADADDQDNGDYDEGHIQDDISEDEDEEAPAERSFMEEMFENDGEYDDDEYVDMPSYDALLKENAKLNRQLASVIAQYERLKKDWDNYRKRTKAEEERHKRLASERVARQIIPVIDDLWRSIDHIQTMGEDMNPIASGNEAIANRIIDALSREGIEIISPLGEPFDVNRHQAIAMQAVEGEQPGIVFRVYQDGYAIGDRVIRPASVGVTQ